MSSDSKFGFVKGGIARTVADKIEARAIENARMIVEEYTRDDNEYVPGNTPIERALIVALMAELKLGGHELDELVFPPKPDAAYRHHGFDLAYGPYLFVWPQRHILDWPVDFLFTINSPLKKDRGLVVECDGHDFHERTKEQGARDRSRDRRLQEAGYTVYRFTGSEIHNDPVACANTIVDWAVGEYC